MNKFLIYAALVAGLLCNLLIANDTDKNKKGGKHPSPVDVEQPVKKLSLIHI